MDRPDLSDIPEEIIRYITYLEAQIGGAPDTDGREFVVSEPAEPPTTINVITLSRGGLCKRTPRHFYSAQRRGGMGVFDIDLPDGDFPAAVLVADLEEDLIVLTNFARVFRLPVAKIPEREVRARGEPLDNFLKLYDKEGIAVVLDGQGGHIAVLTSRAYVVTRNKNFLQDGAILFDWRQSGEVVAACWSTGVDDLFVATKQGKGIRFGVRQVPSRGCLALRLDEGDELLGLTGVDDSSGVLLLAGDGRGTIRQMSGFRANKAPGAGGKVAMNTANLVAVRTVDPEDDILAISRLGKIIRFHAAGIPPKEGVVQGVNCMNLRADEVAAAGIARLRA